MAGHILAPIEHPGDIGGHRYGDDAAHARGRHAVVGDDKPASGLLPRPV